MERIKFLVVSLLCLATACDDGPIYDDVSPSQRTGATVKLVGKVSGIDTWPDYYTVALAGFTANSNYASISKALPSVAPDSSVQVVLSGIQADVERVELCVIDRLRERVFTIADTVCASAAPDTLVFDVGTASASMYQAVQSRVFSTTCAHCHGGADRVAAGLNLTEGVSYSAIVGVQSRKADTLSIVEPGNANRSLLYLMLSTPLSETWHYDHSREVISPDVLSLIGKWIDNGARQ